MPVKAMKDLAKVTFKHTNAGIPDPCIKIRKGSGTALIQSVANPFTAFDIEVGTLLNKKRRKKANAIQKLKKAKKVEVCLF